MQDLTSTSVLFVQTTSQLLKGPSVSVGVPMSVCKDHSCKEKVVVIMGSTGSGKSRLSVDIATCFSGEIINSDKMQFYDGLEISTNQMNISERCGIPHHLLGELPPDGRELTTSEFRSLASKSISDITSRGKLPIVAGGSNSYIHALLVDRFDPETYPFSPGQSFISSDLRYECCFLWVDILDSVHYQHLSKRLDQMMECGMFEELADFYNRGVSRSTIKTGIYQTIGVPEFDHYFELYPPEKDENVITEWEPERKAAYEEAVQAIKENTWQLAKKQKERIMELRNNGWEIQRLDATTSIEASSREVWNDTVLKESVEIVKRFLLDH